MSLNPCLNPYAGWNDNTLRVDRIGRVHAHLDDEELNAIAERVVAKLKEGTYVNNLSDDGQERSAEPTQVPKGD
jgi:hypothetical protein